jgi:hypothetical protein
MARLCPDEDEWMEREHCYALISCVGLYEDNTALPAFSKDLEIMHAALTEGLRFPEDHVRILDRDGRITIREFARALQEFTDLLTDEDLLLIYFSGHGRENSLCFSDQPLSLQSLASFLGKSSIQNCILVLDCCHSGSLTLPGNSHSMENGLLSLLAGRGTAVLASSSKDESSWMGNGHASSLFTEVVCHAMKSASGIRQGRKTLFEIMEQTRAMMAAWNRTHPGHVQHPVFRADMIGTVSFSVRDVRPYGKTVIRLTNNQCVLYDTKSLNTASAKRIAAFLICADDTAAGQIAIYTKDVADELRNRLNDGMSLRAIWCYFGKDMQDMKNSCYMGYGLWTADEAIRDQLCKPRTSGTMCGDIFVWLNPSYKIIRKINAEHLDPEEYIRRMKEFLCVLVPGAEAFISGLHRLENGEIQLTDLRSAVKSWCTEVNRSYIDLSDIPVPEEDLREWGDAVMELADWAIDLAIPLEEGSAYDEGAVRWLLQYAAARYYEAINRIRQAEKKSGIH